MTNEAPSLAWVACVAALVAACEAAPRRLDPPAATDAAAVESGTDAGVALDAQLTPDGALLDVDAGEADSGVRLFAGRIGTVVDDDPGAFEPTDLTGWTLRARSALGDGVPVVDGPGRFSVLASGRVEVSLIPPDERDQRYLVSTEASRVDLVWPRLRREGRPSQAASLDVELARPWSADDRLYAGSSGRWSGAQLSVDASAVGKTRLEGLRMPFETASQLVDEDLWVTRLRLRATATSTTWSLLELGLVRRISLIALNRPVPVQMRAQAPRLPATAWDLTAGEEDGVSLDRATMVTRHFVRPERASGGMWFSPCGGSARIIDVSVQTMDRLGMLPEGDAAPAGYLTCVSLRGDALADTPGTSFGAVFVPSRACLCGPHPSSARLGLGPVRGIRLDGRPLGASDTTYRAPFTLSWQPPAQGLAAGYVVWLAWDVLGAVVITDKTQVTLPAEFIPPGIAIRPVIVAIDDVELPPVESPFLRSISWQSTGWATGALQPEP